MEAVPETMAMLARAPLAYLLLVVVLGGLCLAAFAIYAVLEITRGKR